jgi:hypothetical protein
MERQARAVPEVELQKTVDEIELGLELAQLIGSVAKTE